VDPLIDCPWRLVVSDLDGTLVTGTTALNHLGAWIGHEAIIEGLGAWVGNGLLGSTAQRSGSEALMC